MKGATGKRALQPPLSHSKKKHIPKSFAPYYEVSPQCLLLTVCFLSAFIVLERQAIDVAPNLISKDSRREWEAMFNTSVVTPVLTVCPFPPLFWFIIFYFSYLLYFCVLKCLMIIFLRTSKKRFNVVWGCWSVTIDWVS